MNAYYYTRPGDRRKRRMGRWASDASAVKGARSWAHYVQIDRLYRRDGDTYVEVSLKR